MTNTTNKTVEKKSEILFLYESTYSIPNGDPFTGEQRYDEEIKKVLVSDVRIKRFIRDYLEENGDPIYVSDKTSIGATNSAGMVKHLYENTFAKKLDDVKEILKSCIDVRLFGGISTLKGNEAKVKGVTLKNSHCNLTGPVQFALLNPSLNEVDLRMHQNTSHFKSEEDKKQGAIGTTTVVPYCVNQIHGWINPFSAKHTDLSDNDVNLMLKALWESINNANTRSKSNQNSLLLLQIIYAEPTKKIYGVDRLIKINPNNDMRGEQLRSLDDFTFDFSNLSKIANNGMIEKVRYYTEIEDIKNLFIKDENKNRFENLIFSDSGTNNVVAL